MADISVLIATINDRIQHVPRILLPECEDVCYVVSFQYTDEMFLDMIPAELTARTDVTLLTMGEVGLSANRNNALRFCRTSYAVVADDDTRYDRQLLSDLLDAFRRDPALDIAVFGDNRLAFRLSPLMPRFDTRFGLGSGYLSCGEEEVLIHQAKAYGLKTRRFSFPSYVPERTPWSLLSRDQRERRSWGALQYMCHNSCVAFLRILWRVMTLPIDESTPQAVSHHRFGDRWRIFRDMFDGLRYIMTHPLNDSVAEEIPLDFQPIDIWRMP